MLACFAGDWWQLSTVYHFYAVKTLCLCAVSYMHAYICTQEMRANLFDDSAAIIALQYTRNILWGVKVFYFSYSLISPISLTFKRYIHTNPVHFTSFKSSSSSPHTLHTPMCMAQYTVRHSLQITGRQFLLMLNVHWRPCSELQIAQTLSYIMIWTLTRWSAIFWIVEGWKMN